jgi:hypothetical protein
MLQMVTPCLKTLPNFLMATLTNTYNIYHKPLSSKLLTLQFVPQLHFAPLEYPLPLQARPEGG